MSKRPCHWVWFALLCVACQGLAPPALAPLRAARATVPGVSCTGQMTSITFGNIDEGYYDHNYNLATAGYFTYYCQNGTPADRTVTACISIGNPSGGTLRTLTNGNRAMSYQLYQDAGGAVRWGSSFQSNLGNPYKDTLVVPAHGRSAPRTIPVYAAIDADQSGTFLWIFRWGLPAGTYSATYGTNDIRLDIASGSGAPCATGGGTASGFSISATIKETCQVDAATLDFGTVAGDPGGLATSTLLEVDCATHSGYRVGLDEGKNATGGTRRMRGGPAHDNYVAYQLCQDPGCARPWGNDDGTGNVVTGTQGSQAFRVYGRIPPNQGLPPPGDYFDAVTVYVYY